MKLTVIEAAAIIVITLIGLMAITAIIKLH